MPTAIILAAYGIWTITNQTLSSPVRTTYSHRQLCPFGYPDYLLKWRIDTLCTF